MARLVFLGALAALFFSSTFVLNRAMSLSGGPWVWSAALRYAFMLPILLAWTLASGGPAALGQAFALFRKNPVFWTLAGSIGFGVFYAGVTLASVASPGWVVATTWQSTILATPFVLALLGHKVPRKGLAFTGLIFLGIVLVNLEQAQGAADPGSLWGIAAILVAAVAYPLGNQLVWEARHGGSGRVPRIDQPALDAGRTPTLLLTIGSIPFWLLLLAATRPRPPPPAIRFCKPPWWRFFPASSPPRCSCAPAAGPRTPTSWPPPTPPSPWKSSFPCSAKPSSWPAPGPAPWVRPA